MVVISSENMPEDPTLNSFRDTPQDQWVRETNSTPHCSIGQSPTLCLEVPYTCKLPYLRQHFIYMKEIEKHFILVGYSSLNPRSNLVSIVEPRQEIGLPYNILFKVNSFVQKGIITRPTFVGQFFSLLYPNAVNNHYIDHALEVLSNLKEIRFGPVTVRWLREQYREYEMSGNHPKSSTVPLEATYLVKHGHANFGEVYKIFLILVLSSSFVGQPAGLARDNWNGLVGIPGVLGIIKRKPEIGRGEQQEKKVEGGFDFKAMEIELKEGGFRVFPSRPHEVVLKCFSLKARAGSVVWKIEGDLAGEEVLQPDLKKGVYGYIQEV